MATARTVTAGNFSLTLAGVSCGFVESVDGGGVAADVVEEAVNGASLSPRKHIGSVKYGDITLQIGLGMAQDVYDWIAAAFDKSFVRKDGSIVGGDANFNAQSEQQFFQSLITELTVSSLDASSKDAGSLTLTFSPERVVNAKGSGKLPVGGVAGTKQKQWRAANFRLELDGVDGTQVKRIDSFTLKLHVAVDDIGDSRDPAREPGKIEFPNLRVTIADGPRAGDWQKWADDFIVNGRNDSAHEKSGAIVFLAPDMQGELGRIELQGVGICGLRRGPRTAKATSPSVLIADLYCDRMQVQIGKPAPAPVATPTPVPAPLPRPIAPTRITPLRG